MFNFDIDTVVTPAVKSAKTFSSMITAESVRTAMDAIIDANAELTKTMFGAVHAYTKSFQPISTK